MIHVELTSSISYFYKPFKKFKHEQQNQECRQFGF